MRDIFWTAGFLEGEGCFRYSSQGTGGTITVSASQVQKEPLERLIALYGGSIYTKREAGLNWQKCSQWTLTGPKAAGLMMTIFSILSPRRKGQVIESLTEWKKHKPQNKFKLVCPKGHPYNVENTRIYKNPSGITGRYCRQCKREKALSWYYGHKKTSKTVN